MNAPDPAPELPRALGPYELFRQHRGMFFVSGQLGTADDGTIVTSSFADQVDAALDNVARILASAQLGWCEVVNTTVYLTNLSLAPVFNERYARRFAGALPARALVGVSALPLGAALEIAVIAAQPVD